MKTMEAAKNKWPSLLEHFGISKSFLTGKHGPCPLCQGRDRFRFDDKEGRGTYFCSGCGAGTGMDLLQKFKGWDFKTAAREVDGVVGNCQERAPRPKLEDEKRRELLGELWRSGRPLSLDDPVSNYLAGRKLPMPETGVLRFVPSAMAPRHCGGGWHPTMIALVHAASGKPATIHRTFLGTNGKADIEAPRSTMPGEIPPGSAIRLTAPAEVMGIAEGIETALAAQQLFGVPTWAAINATMLSKWESPPNTRKVLIFGDNDSKFGGAAAAYTLAHRLACKPGIEVEVHIPPNVGEDWADIWLARSAD